MKRHNLAIQKRQRQAARRRRAMSRSGLIVVDLIATYTATFIAAFIATFGSMWAAIIAILYGV